MSLVLTLTRKCYIEIGSLISIFISNTTNTPLFIECMYNVISVLNYSSKVSPKIVNKSHGFHKNMVNVTAILPEIRQRNQLVAESRGDSGMPLLTTRLRPTD